ncbi:unnamed protein product [Peronospora destructor]|uniref:SUN domain-containing protein n=1 Tax=Peronospora destructor TaxID=86335 RepID=A0AAV0VE56_9STRA|nr:unnamed protein product [Peronospora destructor]
MVGGNVYNRRLRSHRRSDATSSDDDEELEDITTSRSQHYGIYTPEPVQRTLVLRPGDDFEEEDEDNSEFEELDDYGKKVCCSTAYKPPSMIEKDVAKPIEVEEENDRDMETHEHRVRRSELKRRAAGAAACFRRPHNGSKLWQKKVTDSKALKKLLKYLRTTVAFHTAQLVHGGECAVAACTAVLLRDRYYGPTVSDKCDRVCGYLVYESKCGKNFLDKTSQLQQDLQSTSKQQAQLSSVVIQQQEKMDFMQEVMKKAATALTPDTANDDELESKMQRKMQAVESRMLRVLQEEKQAFSSSADALRGLDATDPGIFRVIEVAVQAVEIKKTGRVDHAALANGASVIHSERDLLYQDRLSLIQLFTQLTGLSDLTYDARFTSPSYRRAPAPLLGLLLSSGEIPWWLSRHNGRPETALSETIEIGSCWGFAGSSGRLSVKFALQIIADSITIDHIPAQIASDFSSAPNEFRILGISGHPLRETVDFIPFGNFSYASNGPASQTFKLTPLQSQHSAIDGITLEVLSNHGHPEYTCLYRFRVHGQPV